MSFNILARRKQGKTYETGRGKKARKTVRLIGGSVLDHLWNDICTKTLLQNKSLEMPYVACW